MEILVVFISLLLIAFFSGIEIAFLSANKLRVELLKEKGSGRAKIISEFNDKPSKFISTMLVGLNISLVIFGSMLSGYLTREHFAFMPADEVSLVVIQTIITTFIILIFGDLIPKILFRVNSDETLLWFSYPVKYLFYIPLKPFANLFHGLSRGIIKLILGTDLVESKPAFTKEDLEYLVKETAITEGEGVDETDHLNTEMFEKALYLKEVKVRNCMIPRPEIQALEISEGLDALRKKFIETRLSRIIIYDETIDKILGYVHHFDLLKSPAALKPIIRTMQAVPENMTARDLILQFIREKKNVAWVVDEYGGTAGIITLEDLMEEIFGEIKDEHDEENPAERKISDREFILSGRQEISYLNHEYNLGIPEGEYNTLSGYIISAFEDIPESGTIIDTRQFRIKILKATGKRIELVNLQVKNIP